MVWAPKLGLAKRQQSCFYLLSSYELLGSFARLVVSKSLRIEVFHTGLVYYQ